MIRAASILLTVAGMLGAPAASADTAHFVRGRTETMEPIFRQATDRSPNLWRLYYFVEDLDGDGVNEIIFRERASRAKEAGEAITPSFEFTVAKFDDRKQNWTQIGSFNGLRMDIEQDPDVSFKRLLVTISNDAPVKTYGLIGGKYEVDIDMFGPRLSFSPVAEVFAGQEDYLEHVLQRALGSRYAFIKSSSSPDDRAEIAGVDLNHDGVDEYLLWVGYASVCDGLECPLFIFDDLTDGPFATLKTEGPHIVASEKREEGRLRSLYGKGQFWQWDAEIGYSKKGL